MSSLRRESYDQGENHLLQRCELDLIEGKRNTSQLHIASYQRCTIRYFNSKVKKRRFYVEDLVLGKVVHNKGALDQNWEGPYIIVAVLTPGACKLAY